MSDSDAPPLSVLDQPPSDDQPADAGTLPPPAGWPAAPAAAVYDELLGEIVTAIAPHTEADPIAILTQLLVALGAAVGRGAFFQVEATRHHPNEFICAARRLVVSPVQPGVIRKDITGSNGLPRSER
jgi:hypothetical protein